MPEPSVNEKADLALLHLDKSLEFKEGKRAIFEMRRHLSNYFKGLPHFKETRLKLLTAVEVDEIKNIIKEIREKWGDFRTDRHRSISLRESDLQTSTTPLTFGTLSPFTVTIAN